MKSKSFKILEFEDTCVFNDAWIKLLEIKGDLLVIFDNITLTINANCNKNLLAFIDGMGLLNCVCIKFPYLQFSS